MQTEKGEETKLKLGRNGLLEWEGYRHHTCSNDNYTSMQRNIGSSRLLFAELLFFRDQLFNF